MGRPKKATPNVEKAPGRLPGGIDILPEHGLRWEMFLDKFNNLAHTFGYSRVEPPFFEDVKLYGFWSGSAGVESEAVATDDTQLLTLALPQGTAAARPTYIFSLVRMYLENHFPEKEQVSKWSYCGPVSFLAGKEVKYTHEFGFQIFGSHASITDAHLINMLLRLFTEIGLSDLTVELNNIGCIECTPYYQEQLKNYFKDQKYDLCESCLEHLDHGQALRILACRNLTCSACAADAPAVLDSICENCRKQFISVLESLDELSIAYHLNPRVIGSPWSRRTVFEIKFHGPSGEVSLGSGGRADDLVQSLGGSPVGCTGFCGSQEMILSALQSAQVKFAAKAKADVFLVPLGELAAKKTLKLFTELWNHQIIASEFAGPGSIKTQLKLAESNKVSIALIVGQKEAREGTVILRDVRSGMQELFTVDRIIEEVKKRLGK